MQLNSKSILIAAALSLSACFAHAQPSPPPATLPPAMPNGATIADGQWTYTTQYGWVWLPWDQQYTSVPTTGTPLMYAYGPSLGWTWVSAPWIYGWGPVPYYGTFGITRFAWNARPWFVAPRVHVAVRPAHPAWRGGGGWHSGFRGGFHGHGRR